MKYITLNAIDPFSEEDSATNPIYLIAHNIVHFEHYSGPFHLQAWAPNGQVMTTGKYKQLLGCTLLFLAVGGQRIVSESPQQFLEILNETDL